MRRCSPVYAQRVMRRCASGNGVLSTPSCTCAGNATELEATHSTYKPTVGSCRLGTDLWFVSRPIGPDTAFNLERAGKFRQHDCSIVNDRISPKIALLKGSGGRKARYAGPAAPKSRRPLPPAVATASAPGRRGGLCQRPPRRLCQGPPGRPPPQAVALEFNLECGLLAFNL